MNSKKAITLLVLATLLMSFVPLVPVNAEITDAEVWWLDDGNPDYPIADGETVRYDETLTAVGSGVSPGQTIQVYWDAIQPWDGEAGLLNSSKSKKSGAFEVWFDVPEAVVGDHYIWVKDVATGETVMAVTGEAAAPPALAGALMVRPYIKLSPKAGLEDDEITIKGYGYGDEVEIAAEDILINGGAVAVLIVDEELPCSPTDPETDNLGSWTATFDVPALADDYEYDVYEITAEDEDGNINDGAEFTIGPALTLSVEEGPVGTLVTATGRGFKQNGLITQIKITDGAAMNITCEQDDDDDMDIDGDGEFKVTFPIPETIDIGEYSIWIRDNDGPPANIGEADFEVLGLAEVKFTPNYALQGSTVKIEGFNFTEISGEEVLVYFNDGVNPRTKVGEFETDRYGEFDGNIKIPGLTAGTYTVEVEQDDWNINNVEQDASFRVGLVIVILNPEEGPSGALISITGSGFDELDEYNITFGGKDLVDTTGVPAGGGINEEFNVPTMDPGTYKLVVLEVDSGIEVEVDFEVTDRTMLQVSPSLAPNDYNVTIEGWYFTEEADDPTDLTFVLYNETDDWDIDVWYGKDPPGDPVEGTDLVELDMWDEAGYFAGWFVVPDDETLGLGTYTINCTDENGLLAQVEFTIVDKTVDIEPRKTVFSIGDTVAFNVESSFAQDDSYIKIWDPSGNLYWRTDDFEAGEWISVGTIERVPYYEQVAGGNPMTLLEDAPLGTWEWTWYADDNDELDDGTFTVQAAAADVIGEQVADLNNQITDLADQLSDVTSEFDDVRSDIASVSAIAQQAVTAAQQAAEAVQTVAQTANQASTAAENAATAAEAARDAANSLTTLVYGAIGAALVAALAAIVSLMQISRRIAG
jgi:hypothetical protein